MNFFTKLWNTSKYGKKLETLLYLLLAVALQLKSTRYVRLKKGLNRESSILLSNEMHLANGICAEPQGPLRGKGWVNSSTETAYFLTKNALFVIQHSGLGN